MLWVSGNAGGHRLCELVAPDGVIIPYREWWSPDARAVVLYLHGQGDHSGPFGAMGDLLHAAGYSVYAHDQRGFGLSQEPHGDIASYDLFLDDVAAMIAQARRANPGRPIYLLGLSMGGHLALRATCRAGQGIAGVIALSPGLRLKNAPAWSVVLEVAFRALFTPKRYVLPNVTTAVATTRNEEHLARAREDSSFVIAYTARFYIQTVLSIRRALQELRSLPAPVLILQAGDDQLISPEGIRQLFDQIGQPDKEFRMLDGLYHNLVAELEMPAVAAEVIRWIDQRLQPCRLAGADHSRHSRICAQVAAGEEQAKLRQT